MLLGIIEFGIIIYDYNTISNAAREGARYAIVHPPASSGSADCDPPGVDTILSAACWQAVGLPADEVTVSWTRSCNPNLAPGASCCDSSAPLDCVRVDVEYDASLVTAGFFQTFGIPATFSLSTSATMDREQ
jgi:Flp pilus assembly protein TadG